MKETCKKIFWGSFFVLAGVFVIINQMGYYTDINLLTLLITIFIIPILIKSIIHVKFFGILFSLAMICILYNEQLGLEAITPWPILLTALFGSIGLSIIFGKHYSYEHHFNIGSKREHRGNRHTQVINDEDGEEIECSVSFGENIKYVNTDNFKTANLRSHFGSLQVYFDNAKIKGDKATIDIDASFSGIQLYVPREWKIVTKVDTFLGAVDSKNYNQKETTKTVTLTGRVSLAGIEIIYI